MNYTNCGCKTDCTGLAIVASIIIGIITAFLSYTAVITVTPAFLWVVFGIAVVYLIVAYIVARTTGNSAVGTYCLPASKTFFIGVLGTILSSIVLLGITFAATSVIGAIINGLLLLFFALMITTTVCLTVCRVTCNRTAE